MTFENLKVNDSVLVVSDEPFQVVIIEEIFNNGILTIKGRAGDGYPMYWNKYGKLDNHKNPIKKGDISSIVTKQTHPEYFL